MENWPSFPFLLVRQLPPLSLSPTAPAAAAAAIDDGDPPELRAALPRGRRRRRRPCPPLRQQRQLLPREDEGEEAQDRQLRRQVSPGIFHWRLLRVITYYANRSTNPGCAFFTFA